MNKTIPVGTSDSVLFGASVIDKNEGKGTDKSGGRSQEEKYFEMESRLKVLICLCDCCGWKMCLNHR